MFWANLNYIHKNPVKAGLAAEVTDYRYSSGRNYILRDHSLPEADTEYAGIEIKNKHDSGNI